MSGGSTSNWPPVSYIDESTGGAHARLAELELVGTENWRRLYRHKGDGSYWALDEPDKYQERFHMGVKDLNSWAMEDHFVAEKSLLLEQRGGESHALCMWQGCGQRAVRGPRPRGSTAVGTDTRASRFTWFSAASPRAPRPAV